MASSTVVVLPADQMSLMENVGKVVFDLAWNIINNVFRWWNKEITGKRCAANIINGFNALAIGVTTSITGFIIGGFFGILGSVTVGPVLGFTAYGITYASRRFILKLFDLPQSEAAEQAYQYLGVHHTASNEQVKKAYHKLAKTHHPDKGGKENDFKKLLSCMAIIKASRKDFTYAI